VPIAGWSDQSAGLDSPQRQGLLPGVLARHPDDGVQADRVRRIAGRRLELSPKYNPVFLCGGVGLGKTHLLHSIGHQQLANRPSARIVYLSSERFMNEFVQAIRTGRMHEFRRNYREGIDVLLIDDVQFLAGKESTQDEFFHTFNALHENHKQIVLTADRKPHEISDIADRLRTRFAWGLLADIEPPELEVRIAILRKKGRGGVGRTPR